MSQGEVLSICKDAVLTALMLAAPFLIISMIIGIIISEFQAATQINEQTITFVPKIIAIALILLFLGSWLISAMSSFTNNIFTHIKELT